MYEIKITTGEGANPTKYNAQSSKATKTSDDKKNQVDTAKTFKATAIYLGKKAVTDISSRVGSYTGMAGLQQNINNVNKVLDNAVMIGASFAINPALGIASTLKAGYDFFVGWADYKNEQNIQNLQRDYIRNFNTLNNRANRNSGVE